MKSEQEWMKTFGKRPLTWSDYRAIQANVLRHAAGLCRNTAQIHSNPSLAACHDQDADNLESEAAKLKKGKT